MRNDESGMRNGESGMRNDESGMRNGESGIKNTWNAQNGAAWMRFFISFRMTSAEISGISGKIAFALLLALLPVLSHAQTLTLEQALARALEKNHAIQIAKNNAAVAANNAHPGAAGLLPTLTANAGYTKASNTTDLEFSNPNFPPQSASGAETVTKTANVQFQYVLRDGFGNVYRLKQLKAQLHQTEAQTQQSVENTLVQVVSAYLGAVAAFDALDVAKEALETSVTRYKRVETRTGLGAGSNLELLSAEVDLNSDSSSYATAMVNVENAVRNLAFLIGAPVTEALVPDRAVTFSELLDAAVVLRDAQAQNPSLTAARQAVKSTEWFAKATTSALLPTLSLNASYGLTNVENEVGLVLVQQNVGLTGNVALQWNLFDGWRREINRKNARVQLENARENEALAQEQLIRDVTNTFAGYKNNLSQIAKEERSVATARRNLARAQELYGLGQITSTQLREAQLNVSRTLLRLNATRYAAKTAEIELLRLSGRLMEKAGG
jgi:outer membrane protein TolC